MNVGDQVYAKFRQGRRERKIKAMIITVCKDGRVQVEMINDRICWRPVLERAQIEQKKGA